MAEPLPSNGEETSFRGYLFIPQSPDASGGLQSLIVFQTTNAIIYVCKLSCGLCIVGELTDNFSSMLRTHEKAERLFKGSCCQIVVVGFVLAEECVPLFAVPDFCMVVYAEKNDIVIEVSKVGQTFW